MKLLCAQQRCMNLSRRFLATKMHILISLSLPPFLSSPLLLQNTRNLEGNKVAIASFPSQHCNNFKKMFGESRTIFFKCTESSGLFFFPPSAKIRLECWIQTDTVGGQILYSQPALLENLERYYL